MRRILQWVTRWGILIATGIFLVKAFSSHWQDVRTLQFQPQAWTYVAMAIAIFGAAQIWSAVVWGLILESLPHQVPRRWAIITFLKNAPAKYVPGSVWHMYGRVMAARQRGISVEFATLSVILEPLFVIAGALGIALWRQSRSTGVLILILAGILLILHPKVFNGGWQLFRKVQGKESTHTTFQRYPIWVLLGSTVSIGLRSVAFICILLALTPITIPLFQPLMSGFSFAWLLSLVIPAPGGLGVFETSALQVLDAYLSPALLLGAVTIYRLVAIAAELGGAGVAYLISEGKPISLSKSV